MFHSPSNKRMIAMVVAVVVGMGCAAASRQPPVQAGDVNTGPGSLDAVRRQLEGTWDLVTLAVMPARGAALVPVAAQGTLMYDKNGNLSIDAKTSDSYAPEAAQSGGVIAFEGKAVIDSAKSELQLTDKGGNVDPKAAPSPERRRRYAFEGDLLRLSSIDGAGRVTTTSTWRRR
jgi:hypothetical protein